MKNMKRVLSVLMLVVILITSTSLTAFASTKGVVVAKSYLRKGAGKGYAAVKAVPSGTTLTITKTRRDSRGVTWCYASYGGKKGWVSARYMRPTSTTKNVYADGDCFVRAKASKSGAKRATMKAGAYGYYMGSSKKDSRGVRWYKVNYQGIIGWVSSKFASVS